MKQHWSTHWNSEDSDLGYFFFFFFFLILFNFTILYWFCHISKWICHRCTCVPHPEPSSLLPPHTIPLGRSSAPAPSIQYRVSLFFVVPSYGKVELRKELQNGMHCYLDRSILAVLVLIPSHLFLQISMHFPFIIALGK